MLTYELKQVGEFKLKEDYVTAKTVAAALVDLNYRLTEIPQLTDESMLIEIADKLRSIILLFGGKTYSIANKYLVTQDDIDRSLNKIAFDHLKLEVDSSGTITETEL